MSGEPIRNLRNAQVTCATPPSTRHFVWECHNCAVRKSDSDGSEEPPALCAALDDLLWDLNIASVDIAQHLHVEQSTVSRWRRSTRPDPDSLLAIETFIGVQPGTVYRRAGYVVDDDNPRTMVERLSDDPDLTSVNARIVVAAYKAGVEASKETKDELAARRRQRGKIRR